MFRMRKKNQRRLGLPHADSGGGSYNTPQTLKLEKEKKIFIWLKQYNIQLYK